MNAGTHTYLRRFLLTVVKYLSFVMLLEGQNHKMIKMHLSEKCIWKFLKLFRKLSEIYLKIQIFNISTAFKRYITSRSKKKKNEGNKVQCYGTMKWFTNFGQVETW